MTGDYYGGVIAGILPGCLIGCCGLLVLGCIGLGVALLVTR